MALQKTIHFLEKYQIEVLVISSNGPSYYYLDDIQKPFRPNPFFSYFLPCINSPQHFLVISPLFNKPQFFEFGPTDFWHKPHQEELSAYDYFSCKKYDNHESLYKDLNKSLAAFKKKVLLGENCGPLTGIEAPSDSFFNELKELRTIKTPFEIECLKDAAKLGMKAHRKAYDSFCEGKSEYLIHLDYLNELKSQDIDLPYPNIIAINKNASYLHYQNKETKLYSKKTPRSLLIDAGGKYLHYCSDITRTYVRHQPEFQELIDYVKMYQKKCVQMVSPGIEYALIHKQAHEFCAKLLIDFEFCKLDEKNILKENLTSYFFPHGVGHFLGLQVHDVMGHQNTKKGPFDTYLRLSRVLEAGNVVTIEPGFYFIDTLLLNLQNSNFKKYFNWKKINRLKIFGGIRIEDDVVVTNMGRRNLTNNLTL